MDANFMKAILKRVKKYTYTEKAKKTWHTRLDKMADNQIIATYLRMQNNGELTNDSIKW